MADEPKKPTCFVIQQFDEGGTFDKRYSETIRPALVTAGVEPLRADTILGLTPIINKIEKAIKEASICIAEISTDNSNVWLELGYALALDRPTVILCDKQIRSKLPFDIAHRPVIMYRADSKSGFEELEKSIVKLVKSELDSAKNIESNPLLNFEPKDFEDLKGYEIAILASLLAQWASSPDGVVTWEIEKRLKNLGFTEINLNMGVVNLLAKKYITQDRNSDMDREWFTYRLTPEGLSWLQANEDKIEVQQPRSLVAEKVFPDDDIPF